MKNMCKTIVGIGLTAMAGYAISASVNPYPYFSSAIDEAKWQRGYNSEQQCYESGCSSTMGTSTALDYLWMNSNNGLMAFTTDGSKSSGWRSEFRYNDNFNRGSSRTMTAGVRYFPNLSTSSGFTVAQLHMDKNEGWTVNGPPARLEVVDESHYEVTFRSGHDCSSNCWTDLTYSTSVTSRKDIQLETSGDYVNVSVEGETFSYYLKGSGRDWPSQGGYYWKTGIYLQGAGTAYVNYSYLTW